MSTEIPRRLFLGATTVGVAAAGIGAASGGTARAATPESTAAASDSCRPIPQRPVKGVNQQIAAQFDITYKALPEQVVGVDVETLMSIYTEADIAPIRQKQIDYIWKGGGLPAGRPTVERDVTFDDIASLTGVARIDKLTVQLKYKVTSTIYQVLPKGRWNRRIALYHNGHGEPLDTMLRTVQGLLDHGYSVLMFAMPFYHWNIQEIQDPTDPTKMLPNPSHNDMPNWESVTFSPLTFFLEPLPVALNYVMAEYRPTSVQMMGLSGGGWTTTVYPALDPRITRSYPTAGSFPFYLRPGAPKPHPTIGDWEQQQAALPDFYGIADFLDMYVMASVGPRRRQIQILNRFDACCFNGVGARSYANPVANRVAVIGDGHWEMLEDATHDEHTISPYALSVILWDLEVNGD